MAVDGVAVALVVGLAGSATGTGPAVRGALAAATEATGASPRGETTRSRCPSPSPMSSAESSSAGVHYNKYRCLVE